MTCLMSPSKRALLARWEVAGTVEYWGRRNDVSSNILFCRSRARALMAALRTPPPRDRESWEGDGPPLGWGVFYLALSQGDATDAKEMK